MRKPLVVGILSEDIENGEARTPLTPSDVLWLKKRKIDVEVQSNPIRVFRDAQYNKCKAKVVDKFRRASLLVGIKPPKVKDLKRGKIYMIFSHTIKGQQENIPFLRACLKNKITLIDYEKIADIQGKRLVHFGRFAGICGVVDSLHYYGKKLEYQGIKNPFSNIKPAHRYRNLNELKCDIKILDYLIHRKGFDKKLAPFIIGITGHGNVSSGVQEIVDMLHPIEVHPKDMFKFARRQKRFRHKIYKIVFLGEEKYRSKKGSSYYFEEYLKYGKKFESNMDKYLPYLNILIHASYWDYRYPRLVTKEMVDRLYKRSFRLQFIADISCDICGSIEFTHKTTTLDDPVYTYMPKKQMFNDGYKVGGITVLARDNLPTELPHDASAHFSSLVREYIYQIAEYGVKDITNHIAIPREIRGAVIAQGGRLAKSFKYLHRYI